MANYRFSDAELLTIELIVADPYAGADLTLEKLSGDINIVEAVNIHDYNRFPADRVHCCVCGARRHKKGFRVNCSDKSQRLLGKCCAKPILVQSWRQMEAELRELIDRQRYIRQMHALQPAMLRGLTLLASWYELAHQLRAARYEFRTVMPEVFELVQRACEGDGVLLATERVKQYDHANRRDRKDDDKDKGFRWVHVPVRHYIRGRAYLRKGDPVDLPKRVEEAINLFRSVGNHTDQLPTSSLKRICMRLQNSIDELGRLRNMRDAASEFFGSENLAGVGRWVELLRSGHDRSLLHDVGLESGRLINVSTRRAISAPVLSRPDMGLFAVLSHAS